MSRNVWLAVALGVLVAPAMSRADNLDIQLYKLGNPKTDPYANAKFATLMNDLGVAIVNWNLEPAETTGFSGFNFGFEYPVSIVPDGNVLAGDPTKTRYFAYSTNYAVGGTPGALQMPGVHIRKGLPFSFEAGVKVNYIEQSNMVATTVEVKWALNEGFLFFPDLSVRGFGTQLLGARDFTLTVAGFDMSIGHQFPVAGMMTITPYGGWNLIWVAASSDVVDFNPGQSQSDQYHDNADGTASQNVFNQVNLGDNRHNRLYGGIRFIANIVDVTLEVNYANVETGSTVACAGSSGPTCPTTPYAVHAYDTILTYAAKVGLDF